MSLIGQLCNGIGYQHRDRRTDSVKYCPIDFETIPAVIKGGSWLGRAQLTDTLLARYVTEPAHYAKTEFAERGAVAQFFYGKGK